MDMGRDLIKIRISIMIFYNFIQKKEMEEQGIEVGILEWKERKKERKKVE